MLLPPDPMGAEVCGTCELFLDVVVPIFRRWGFEMGDWRTLGLEHLALAALFFRAFFARLTPPAGALVSPTFTSVGELDAVAWCWS